MKKLLAILVLAGVAQAGVVKFTGKHVIKPAAKGTVKVAKLSGHGLKKLGHGAKKVAY